MITCERCQTKNIEGSQYCDECGAAMPVTSATGKRLTSDDALAPSEPVTNDSERGRPAAPEPHPVRGRSQIISPAKTSIAGKARGHEDSKARPHEHEDSKPSPTRVHEDSSPRRASASGSPHAKLVINRGRSVGKEFAMCEEESHIGRWDADGGIFPDIDLDSDDPEAKVSRRHARITRRVGQYYIEDLGSTNGTFVNRGRRLLPGDRQPLRDGDEVIVGKTFLKFHVLEK
ncbi:MAG: hypothetical protein QOC61_1454 [Acidobacteriota bacterium]|jgi:hypothetical protein|nr:hypothetical protein [Acidobacteriota bacterium]